VLADGAGEYYLLDAGLLAGGRVPPERREAIDRLLGAATPSSADDQAVALPAGVLRVVWSACCRAATPGPGGRTDGTRSGGDEMRHRRLSLIGWLVAAVTLAGAAVGSAASQPGLPDGAFVTAPDGSRWAVGNGARVRLTFASDDTNALAGLRDAGTAATLAEAAAALGGGPPAPAATPSNPAQTLVGQSVTACGEQGGTHFQVMVTGADWQRTIVSHTATGNARWVVLTLDITNLGSGNAGPYQGVAAVVKLVDDRGREHVTLFFEPYYTIDKNLSAENGLASFTDPIRPGITERRVLAFEVPPDVQRLTLTSLAPCS
jgi:hypothetical protein